MTIVYSDLGNPYGLGLQPNDGRKPRVRLARMPGRELVVPESADWISPVSAWPMLANDRIGDCVPVGAAHTAQMVNLVGQGIDSVPSDAETIAMYSAISGYDPVTGRGDVGATLQDGLSYWRLQGVGGNRIGAFAQIDAADEDMVKACIATFGSVYTGFGVPQSALDQFDRGEPWTVSRRGSRMAGGHCVPIMGYGPGQYVCVTWARPQIIDADFYRRYFASGQDVWVPVDLDWMRANGTLPNGMDTASANAQYRDITGQQIDPFPVAPAPPVEPPPVGPVSDDDAALIAAYDRFASEFAAWRAVIGS
jgi:hypothetical protein